MSPTSGVRALKNDPLTTHLPINIDQHQSIKLLYEIEQLEDIHQIKRITGDDLKINYPVKHIDQFEALRFIESQFAAHNSREGIDDTLIDRAIYELIPVCLKHEGLQLPNNRKEAARVRALILKQSRNINSTGDLIKYLNDSPETAKLFGLEMNNSNLSTSTLSRTRIKFGMDRQLVQNSIYRIRRALIRNGICPDSSGNECGEKRKIPQDSEITYSLRYQGLINWCDLLLEKLTEDITFNRSKGSKYTIREIIATLAVLISNNNDHRGWRLAQLRYKDDIITPSRINQIIYQSIGEENFTPAKESIENIGSKLNENLLQFAADELGFFSRPLNIAFDPTWVSLPKKIEYEKVPGAMGNPMLTGNGGFCFATGASVTPMSKFSLGVKLLTDKSTLPDTVNQMLLMIDKYSDIGKVIADREFDRPEIIEQFKFMAGNKWVVRCRKHNDLIDAEEYRRLRRDGKAVISFGGTTINAFWKDISESNINFGQINDDDDFIVLSGAELDDNTITDLASIYSERWLVETYIRELKHDFGSINRNKRVLEKLFMLNISSVFYNIFKIINQSLSPSYGLPLRPTFYEVLFGVAESTFSHRSQFQYTV
jgi:hypothetical protein